MLPLPDDYCLPFRDNWLNFLTFGLRIRNLKWADEKYSSDSLIQPHNTQERWKMKRKQKKWTRYCWHIILMISLYLHLFSQSKIFIRARPYPQQPANILFLPQFHSGIVFFIYILFIFFFFFAFVFLNRHG